MNTYSKKVNNEEVVVFCDEHGKPTGEVGPKLDSHTADTQRHLAFSVYVFNPKGELLVTKRADSKKVWPSVWTNSCCGHLAPGETFIDAAKRRLQHELGMTAFDFETIIADYAYETPPYNGIIEREFCPVLFARSEDDIVPHKDEVSEFMWMNWEDFIATINEDTDDWSWWCKDQVAKLTSHQKVGEFTRDRTDSSD